MNPNDLLKIAAWLARGTNLDAERSDLPAYYDGWRDAALEIIHIAHGLKRGLSLTQAILAGTSKAERAVLLQEFSNNVARGLDPITATPVLPPEDPPF